METLTSDQFDDFALELAHFQAEHNPVYAAYLAARRIRPASIKEVGDIPYLPIRFFKDATVYCGKPEDISLFYSSSGTTEIGRAHV